MKTKTIGKKLSLNKKTVTHLNVAEMKILNGGGGGFEVAPGTTTGTCSENPCAKPTTPRQVCTWTYYVIDSICVLCTAPNTDTV